MARRIVFSKRLQLNGLLSVASGMPLGWVFNTFQFFLVDLGVTRAQIGLLSSVSLPWTVKFCGRPSWIATRSAGPVGDGAGSS